MSQTDAIETLGTAAATEIAAAALSRGATCRNCGTVLNGPYCAACGQAVNDRSKSLGAMIGDGLRDFLHFDSRVLRTLAMLLFLPGRMTRQFIDGRRASFVPPLRLYLFSSLIFFLTLSFSNVALFVVDLVQEERPAARAAEMREAMDEVARRMAASPDDPVLAAQMKEAIRRSVEAGQPMEISIGTERIVLPPGTTARLRFFVDLDSWEPNLPISRLAAAQSGVLGGVPAPRPRPAEPAAPEDAATEGTAPGPAHSVLGLNLGGDWEQRLLRGIAISLEKPDSLNRVMGDNLAKSMFVLMPFYAVLLCLLYVRHRLYFVDHLIYALHLHAFLFVLLTLIVLVKGLAPEVMAGIGPTLGLELLFGTIAVYSWIAMRRTYGQGVIRTTLKWLVVGSSYLLALLITVAAALIVSLPDV